MKKLLALFTIGALLLFIPVPTFGAVHLPADAYAEMDTWFTIEPERPYLESHYWSTSAGIEELGFQYYRNEQSFLAYNYVNIDRGYLNSYTTDTYYASFLTGFGLFAGLYMEMYSGTTLLPVNKMIISPGFRFNINDESYIVVSVDYLTFLDDSNNTSEITDYEINLRYYTDNMKLISNVFNYAGPGNNYRNLGASFQVAEPLVIGVTLRNDNYSNTIFTGGTFKNEPFIIDAKLIYSFWTSGEMSMEQYTVSGVFLLDDSLKIGAEYHQDDFTDNDYPTLKAVAGDQKNSFIFKYSPEHGNYPSLMSFSFERQL